MTEIDDILGVLENSTRRAILRRLLLESSYALEISKSLGVSQQAINKQLEVLQRANFILLSEMNQNSFGPPRKIYTPTGFSSVIIDYTPSFIDIRKYNLEWNEANRQMDDVSIDKLLEVDRKIAELMETRQSLIMEKNAIVNSLKKEILMKTGESIVREILLEYVETLDVQKIAEEHGLDKDTVLGIIERYL